MSTAVLYFHNVLGSLASVRVQADTRGTDRGGRVRGHSEGFFWAHVVLYIAVLTDVRCYWVNGTSGFSPACAGCGMCGML